MTVFDCYLIAVTPFVAVLILVAFIANDWDLEALMFEDDK